MEQEQSGVKNQTSSSSRFLLLSFYSLPLSSSTSLPPYSILKQLLILSTEREVAKRNLIFNVGVVRRAARRPDALHKVHLWCSSSQSGWSRVCEGGRAGRFRKILSVRLAAPTVCLCLCSGARCQSGPSLSPFQMNRWKTELVQQINTGFQNLLNSEPEGVPRATWISAN